MVFWVWASLIIVTLAALVISLISLFGKATKASEQVAKLAEGVDQLSQLSQRAVQVAKPIASIEQDPVIAKAARLKLQRSKAKKRQARQRRLLESVKKINVDESRFR